MQRWLHDVLRFSSASACIAYNPPLARSSGTAVVRNRAMAEIVHLKLSIWRNFAPLQPISLYDEQTGSRMIDSDVNLQTEVYSWSSEEPFSGIASEAVRDRLRELLVDGLAISLPPTERGLDALDRFVVEAENAIRTGEAGPVPINDLPVDRGPHGAIETNPLLALVLHLKWLVACFKDRPGISVSLQ